MLIIWRKSGFVLSNISEGASMKDRSNMHLSEVLHCPNKLIRVTPISKSLPCCLGSQWKQATYGYDDCTVKCEWWPNEFWIFPMYTCLPQQKLLNLTFKWQMSSSVEGTATIETIDNHTFANEASADKVIWSQTKSSAIQHPFISKLLFQSERIYRRISHYQWHQRMHYYGKWK